MGSKFFHRGFLKIHPGFILVLFVLNLPTGVSCKENDPGKVAGEKVLVWSDEFDYEGLPDPSKWDYEEGFIRNKELSCPEIG